MTRMDEAARKRVSACRLMLAGKPPRSRHGGRGGATNRIHVERGKPGLTKVASTRFTF